MAATRRERQCSEYMLLIKQQQGKATQLCWCRGQWQQNKVEQSSAMLLPELRMLWKWKHGTEMNNAAAKVTYPFAKTPGRETRDKSVKALSTLRLPSFGLHILSFVSHINNAMDATWNHSVVSPAN